MGSISIPLWFSKQAAAVRAARLKEDAAEAGLEHTANQMKAELAKTLYRLSEAERKIALYQTVLIPKGIESLKSSEKAYIGGTIEFINLIDARRRLLEFQLALETSLVSFEKTKAELAALMGRKL